MAKLCSAKSEMLLVAAVFISLSGFASTIEGHKCYWCGILADQVHRSRRSQPCNTSTYEETTCDPGYDYCAVIATSPPLSESRVCVKTYQDECYPVYCNSSRHWRVVCPCRGELCNGLATEREIESFTTLFQKTKRSISKTQKKRTRRAIVASSNFISAKRPKAENITATETSTMNNIVNQTTNDNQTQSDLPDKKIIDNHVQSTGYSDGMTKIPEDNEITNALDEETNENQQNYIESIPDNIENMLTAMSTVSDEITHKEESTMVQSIISSKNSLTAKALQQNVSPEKQAAEIMTTLQATTPTTHGASAMSMFTKEPNKNNTASIIHNQIFTSIIGILLHHYL